mgnify:CR=1 FL=1
MTCTLAGGKFAVCSEFDGTLVILVESGFLDGVALGLHEVEDVKRVWEIVAGANELGLGGALGVEFLSGGFADDTAGAEGDDAAGVTAHVVVGGESGVDPSVETGEGVGTEDERFVFGAV